MRAATGGGRVGAGADEAGCGPGQHGPGRLVDAAALAEALASGHLRAAGLDALAAEPLPRDHPLRALGNAILSPRAAWLTLEALRRALRVAVENGRRLREGRSLLHRMA